MNKNAHARPPAGCGAPERCTLTATVRTCQVDHECIQMVGERVRLGHSRRVNAARDLQPPQVRNVGSDGTFDLRVHGGYQRLVLPRDC